MRTASPCTSSPQRWLAEARRRSHGRSPAATRRAVLAAISASGQYTPPSYLTADRVEVVVTAALKSESQRKGNLRVTLTPGFLQPLTPENVALGANGTVILTGYLAEAGGAPKYTLRSLIRRQGSSGGEGSLGPTNCQRQSKAFTSCTVTYTAPSTIAVTGVTYVVATAGIRRQRPRPRCC